MRRAPTLAVGVVIAWAWAASTAKAGVWMTLAAGVAGSSTPTDSTEFWFDTPHGPPVVAVSQLTGGITAQAGTAGGTAFFGGAATPVVLNLADGSAYISSGTPPAGALTSGASGGTRASAAPDATATSAPSGAALLGINVADPANGKRTLTANVTDAAGNVLGTGQVGVPTDGWWVIGLGPKDATPPVVDPPVVDPPVPPVVNPPVPPVVDPPVVNPPVPPVVPPPGPGPVATPEPSTLALCGIGGAVAALRRRRK